MFTVTRTAPDRLDVEFGGKLDGEAMKRALDELVEKSEGIHDGCMMSRVRGFEMPTLEALMVELSRLPAMMKFIRKFRRCAVVAEPRWVKIASQIEGALIPGLAVKGFSPDEEADAEAWLAKN